jgi:[ribosomal protein S18]-alanine N-acetyltransferase
VSRPQAKARLTLRRMEPADVPAVVEIERASFPRPWGPQQFLKELQNEWSTLLLALDGDELCGFVLYWVVHDELHILNVACAPARRRQGIARTLLEEVEARARKASIALLTLEVRRSNTAAQALYEGLGYQKAGVRKKYYQEEGEDALVMNKALAERGF